MRLQQLNEHVLLSICYSTVHFLIRYSAITDVDRRDGFHFPHTKTIGDWFVRSVPISAKTLPTSQQGNFRLSPFFSCVNTEPNGIYKTPKVWLFDSVIFSNTVWWSRTRNYPLFHFQIFGDRYIPSSTTSITNPLETVRWLHVSLDKERRHVRLIGNNSFHSSVRCRKFTPSECFDRSLVIL